METEMLGNINALRPEMMNASSVMQLWDVAMAHKLSSPAIPVTQLCIAHAPARVSPRQPLVAIRRIRRRAGLWADLKARRDTVCVRLGGRVVAKAGKVRTRSRRRRLGREILSRVGAAALIRHGRSGRRPPAIVLGDPR